MKRAVRCLGMAALTLLASCAGQGAEPTLPAPPWIVAEVQVAPEGDARVVVIADGTRTSELGRLATDVATSVFPGASLAEPVVGDEDASLVSVSVGVPDAFRGGSAPSFAVPGPDLEPMLRAAGAETLRLSVCLPPVATELTADPATPRVVSGGCTLFLPGPGDPLPEVTASLHPSAWRWVAAMALVAIAFAAALVAVARRRRALAAAALLGVAAAAAVGLGSQVDATVAGLLTPGAIAALTGLTWWVAVAAALLSVAALVRARRGRRRAATPEPERPQVPVH